jgi:hypothetical protein
MRRSLARQPVEAIAGLRRQPPGRPAAANPAVISDDAGPAPKSGPVSCEHRGMLSVLTVIALPGRPGAQRPLHGAEAAVHPGLGPVTNRRGDSVALATACCLLGILHALKRKRI